MSDIPEHPVKLPLRLRANPDIDSPEAMLATLSRLTQAYVDATDFPIDALNTTLIRGESLLLVMQCQLNSEDRVTDEVLSHMVWTVEGLISQALTMTRLWGRHFKAAT